MAFQLPRGVPTILFLVRSLCHAVGKFGTAGLATATTPELAVACEALRLACNVFEALDDNPFERDTTGGSGDFPLNP